MDSGLTEQFVDSLFRIKRISAGATSSIGINFGELIVLKNLDKNFNVSDIQKNLNISMPAVSQMLNSLQKRGYITREIDSADRRKILVSLTPEGKEVLQRAKESQKKFLESAMLKLGEEDAKQIIRVIGRLADIVEELNKERGS